MWNDRTAPALFIASGFSQYLGAAIGAGLFAVMPVAGVAWWRVALAAVILSAIWRPWKQKWTRKDFLAACLFGVFLGTMNIVFYEAMARLPLGVAVSLEFLGPVVVALVANKGWRSACAALLALLGVVAIGGWGLDTSEPQVQSGIVFALVAAAMWAGYIVLGQRIASRRSGVASLSVGVLFAAVIFLPVLLPQALDAEPSWALVGGLALMAVLSSVIPYSVEAIALGHLAPGIFALLTALLPATSTVVGVLALHQIPHWPELLGLVLISGAVWLALSATNGKTAEQV